MVKGVFITLLTTKQFEQYSDIIPKIHKPWWLQDHNGLISVRCIDCNHNIIDIPGSYYCGVRPLIGIVLEQSASLKQGDRILLGSKYFTILYTEGMLVWGLCDDCIRMQKFDDTPTKPWNVSFLKQWLETEGLKLIF